MKFFFITIIFATASFFATAKEQLSITDVVFLGKLSMKANDICDRFDVSQLADIFPGFGYLNGKTKRCNLKYYKYGGFNISKDSSAIYDPETNHVIELYISFTEDVFYYLQEVHELKYGLPHAKNGEGRGQRVT